MFVGVRISLVGVIWDIHVRAAYLLASRGAGWRLQSVTRASDVAADKCAARPFTMAAAIGSVRALLEGIRGRVSKWYEIG